MFVKLYFLQGLPPHACTVLRQQPPQLLLVYGRQWAHQRRLLAHQRIAHQRMAHQTVPLQR